MPLPSESEVRQLLERVLGFSRADECQVAFSARETGNLRFARNTVTTSGGAATVSLGITASFGRRSGFARINELDVASLERGVRTAEELARLAPENPEHVPLLGPQTYPGVAGAVEATSSFSAAARADAAGASIRACRDAGVTGAGFFEHGTVVSALANSRGLWGFQRTAGANFSVTTRTPDGRGSGYGVADVHDVRELDAGAVSSRAARKALASRETRALEPGKYTVILEPAATVDLIGHMVSAMDARRTDEGRSFLSKAGGGSRLGEKLFDERVTLSSDPPHPALPGDRWADDGRPQRRVDWVKNGVVTNLAWSRYWARHKGVAGEGIPSRSGGPLGGEIGVFESEPGLIMAGGSDDLDALIRGVKRGILVTRFWYIRMVDPQTELYTGLTRDGTFYVENGEVKFAVKNFRFNESPVIMLNNLEALGRPERVNASLIPPLVVRDFTFSSLSDAV